jgi:3-phenylpropionate/cinnamic acid dioxygenase small subunit
VATVSSVQRYEIASSEANWKLAERLVVLDPSAGPETM